MWLMDKNDPLVQSAGRAYQKQFLRKADYGTWKFSTNGVVTKGMCGIPTIGLGPGKEEHAHTPQEQVTVDEIIKAMEFYAALVMDWSLQ